MATMTARSLQLLQALLRPVQSRGQIRASSTFMPREKYAKLTRLDKLHRKQKAAIRQERQDSVTRANSMQRPSLVEAASPTTEVTGADVTSPTKPIPASTALPYTISRTQPGNLPVYETTKAGGSKHITQIRKISGDLESLQMHIREALNLPPYIVDKQGRKKENVAINWTTRQIVVRGWRGPEIKKWAAMLGF